MKRALLALLLLAGPAHAETEPASLFAQEADVRVEAPGLQRLDLPESVLSACAADLADLRLVGPNGEVVPYIVDGGRGLEVRRTYEPEKVRVVDRLRRSDRDVVGLRWTEILEFPAPPRAADGVAERWTLTVITDQVDFVRFIQVETRIGGRPQALLPEGSTVHSYADGRRRLQVELPPLGDAPLKVTLSGNDRGWLRPSFRLEAREAFAGGEEIEVPLTARASRSEGGATTMELDRPAGLAIGAIRVRTSTPTFDRPVVVWDEGADRNDAVLGRGSVFAVEGASPLGQDRIAVARPRGDRLRVVIQDGDSPPLADLSVRGVLRRPALIFSATGPLTLRFGGDRVDRPRYDLQRLLPQAAQGDRAQAAARLFEGTGRATLGPPRSNPTYDDGPLLAGAMRAGAELDPQRWASRRAVQLPAGGDGPARIRLDPADLAALRPDLGDLRVVDPDGRQWPYVLQRGARAVLDVPVKQTPDENGTAVTLTFPPATVDRLELDVGAPFFDRAVELWGTPATGSPDPDAGRTADADRRLLVTRLTRALGDPRAVVLAFGPERLETLRLLVRDGDDAPLDFQAARLRVETADLLVVAPPGPYTVLLGNPAADAPTYELGRIRDTVLAVRSTAATPGPLEPTPGHRPQIDTATGRTYALWAVMLLALLGLGFTTLRSVRGEGPASD